MKLQDAKKIVFEKKPVFADLYNKYKDKTWIEYINENYPIKPKSRISEEFADIFEETITNILGKDEAKSARDSLLQTGFVDTADHHGLLCHPFFANINIAKSSRKIISRPITQIVLTVGSISPTNSSLPRALFFHDENLDLIKLNLLSLAGRRRSLYGIQALSKVRFLEIKDKIHNFKIPNTGKKKLLAFFDFVSRDTRMWQCKHFSEQLTILNSVWWREIFGDARGDLLYLEVEQVVRNIFLNSTDPSIWKIILDPEIRKNYLDAYEKVPGAHDTANEHGSHFFWYIDKDSNSRKQLFIEGNSLITPDGETSINLDQETISKYLKNYELLPTMALCYSLLSFHFGLTLGGGFSQIQYLGEMKNAWIKVFQERSKELQELSTQIFSGEAGIMGISSKTKDCLATLADFLIYTNNKDDANNRAETALDETTVGHSLDLMMDEFVEIITGKYEKIEDNSKPDQTLII